MDTMLYNKFLKPMLEPGVYLCAILKNPAYFVVVELYQDQRILHEGGRTSAAK